MSQIYNADSVKDILDLESLLEFEANLNNIINKNLIATLMATDVKHFCKKIKNDKQINCINEKKQDNLADKIFDYIYMV